MQSGNTNFIYRNDLDKACFQHDMASGKSKNLEKRTQSDNVLRDKAFKIAIDPKDDGYQMIKNQIEAVLLLNLLLNQIINLKMKSIGRSFEKLKDEKFIHLLGTIFGGDDLADMQWLSKYNKGIKYLLCAIDLFSKYEWVVPLKDKRGITIVNALQKIISNARKPNEIWNGQGGEF